MELLKLLSHGKQGASSAPVSAKPAASTATTIATNVEYDDGGADSDDDGPFFDLEFSLPLLEDEDRHDSDSDADYAEDFDLVMSPDAGRCGRVGGRLRRDIVASLSPWDELFFKGRLLPLEPSFSSDFATFEPQPCSKPHVPAFLLKPAAKLRVLKLPFHKKSKSSTLQHDHAASTATSQQLDKSYFINLKAEEALLGSRFSRDSSSRSSCSGRSARLYGDEASPLSEACRSRKDVIHRYISKIKPFYIRISKRYGEKLRFSGPLGGGAAGKVRPAGEGGEATVDQPKELSPVAGSLKVSVKSQDGNLPAGLSVVCRRLRKSRSASAAVSSMRSPPVAASRQDTSLQEQQDGIQSAIAHCKRSFNQGSESPLMRSRSDHGDGRSMESNCSSNL